VMEILGHIIWSIGFLLFLAVAFATVIACMDTWSLRASVTIRDFIGLTSAVALVASMAYLLFN
jgi:hypothetical protein